MNKLKRTFKNRLNRTITKLFSKFLKYVDLELLIELSNHYEILIDFIMNCYELFE